LRCRPLANLRWLAVPAAIVLAGLSLAQAASGQGIEVSWTALLGPSFHAWQPGVAALEQTLLQPGAAKLDAARLRQAEMTILADQPLASAALRLGGWSAVRQGREAEALGRIRMIERITRRDAIVQFWLIEDAVRRDDVVGALRRYDAVMRTQADLRDPLLTKLADQLTAEPVRSALAKYADARSPWFPKLLQLAGRTRRAKEAAALLAELPALPDTVPYRSGYGAIVAALAEENRFTALREVYPKLPGAGAGSLTDVGLPGAAPFEGYAPLRWNLASGAERGATAEADALAVRAAPFGKGLVASRLVLPPQNGPAAFSWTVEVDGRGSSDARAHWVIECRDTGKSVSSSDLLGAPRGTGTLAMPYPCAGADLTLIVDGGTGGEGPAFRLMRLRTLPATQLPDSQNRPLRKLSLR
jgi:hypothetical protein